METGNIVIETTDKVLDREHNKFFGCDYKKAAFLDTGIYVLLNEQLYLFMVDEKGIYYFEEYTEEPRRTKMIKWMS